MTLKFIDSIRLNKPKSNAKTILSSNIGFFIFSALILDFFNFEFIASGLKFIFQPALALVFIPLSIKEIFK